ncbi:PPE domain-containing protein [Gordonia sp. zg691]|uniref:PPE domain-containing protein n=1 Tax=Gordonia jinghuaiqii TaxID=2758710 RepID=UPI0016625709|nr:PPE domain-containing protein [Gordonia jinghuaiqii]MBD0860864.1 PPE domain-containing protein [Gordonia jinghuaiqii]
MIGFTGINWDARTSEQLAADLGTGPGPAPLVEAGMAWASLAVELGEAGVDFAAVITRLGVHWQSAHTSAAFEKLTRLAPWFAEASTEAAHNAARAQAQAAAVTVARMNMPDLAEVDIVEKLHEIATTATAVAPIIAGAAAQAERAVQQQRMRAARVMQTYEQATEPVAKPWLSGRAAPDLVSGEPLAVEKAAAARAAAPSVPSPVMPAVAPMPGMVPGVHLPPAEKSRYATTMLASGQSQAAAPAATPIAPAGATGPGVPPPMAPGLISADRGATIRTTAMDADASGESAAEAAESVDGPVTWADLATSDQPAAHYVSAPDSVDRADVDRGDVDPRYLSETLMLGDPGERR